MATFASEPLKGLLPKPVVTLAIDIADGLDAAHQPNKIGQNEIDRERVNSSSPGRKFDILSPGVQGPVARSQIHGIETRENGKIDANWRLLDFFYASSIV